jgi:CubicO group peptidase (beta-lactamase class C family)
MTTPPEFLAPLAADTGFSGAVQVDRGEQTEWSAAFGQADRRHGIANTVQTVFATASATKGWTALTVASLVQDGLLALDRTARSVLGADLPLIRDDVTVEHLLSHRSGIGDYVDEEVDADISDYLLPVSAHELGSTEAYLRVLEGWPTKFAPDERFAYCNSGYVVLALIAERVAGVPFAELVQQRVCRPAGMADTGFLRSDRLPGQVAVGYVQVGEEWRSNVFHLPVLGSGDGGIYSTLADVHRLWTALFAGEIVSPEWVARLLEPRSEVPSESSRYGMGFWLHPSTSMVRLEGYDAGVSFRSVHDPETALTRTTVSNTSDGAWPVARELERLYQRT